MDNSGVVELLHKKFIYIILSMFLFLSCLPKEEVSIDAGLSGDETDFYSGHYYNSSKDHVLKSIEIIHDDSEYNVNFHYTKVVKKYSGLLRKNEIVVKVDDRNAFHLYKNYEELRVYKIVEEGYQPEDIEWTFYKLRE